VTADGALAGFRVVERDTSVAARYCGHLLAALGADVVAVREVTPDDTGLGASPEAGVAYGRWLDAGKCIIAETGADEGCDLAIGGPPGDAAGAVHVVITWFGDDGPYAGWQASDEIIRALSGVAYAFGPAEGPPVLAQGYAPQILAGAQAANVALAALLQPRARRPRRIDVSVLEAALCLSEVGAVSAMANPRATTPRVSVNRFVPTYPCSNYRARDGWIGVTCLTPAQWRAMCEAIGAPALAAEPAYRSAVRRLFRADEIDAALVPAFAQRTAAEWVAEGVARRIPIVALPRPSELPQVAHWAARGAFAPIDETGVLVPTLPFLASAHAAEAGARREIDESGGDALAPLAGVRVIDFSMGWAGPLAARTLADLGADVIKVESDGHPDWYRGWEGDRGGDPPLRELQPNFNTLNRSKRGVDVDLATPSGARAARRLIATADVVIENYAAGVMRRLGLGQEEHLRLRPDIVSVSMPAFGGEGPMSAIRAYGSTVEQASGLPFVNGEEDWPPCLQHAALGDAIAGVFAVTATLAGLHLRRRGAGVAIDLAQAQCLFQAGADAIIGEQVLGAPLPRTGNRRRGVDCRVVRAAGDDAWLAVVVRAGQEPTVAALTGSDGLDAWARARGAREGAEALQRAGIAAAPVQPTHELGADAHLRATGFWLELERRHSGRHAVGAAPFRIDGRRPEVTSAAPTLGEHNAEVLGAP